MVQNTDLLIIILPKINFGPAQNTKLHVSLLCQVVQITGGPKIQNTDGAPATSVFWPSLYGPGARNRGRAYVLYLFSNLASSFS